MECVALALHLRDDARSGGGQYPYDSPFNPGNYPHPRRVTRQGKWKDRSCELTCIHGSISILMTYHRTTRDGLGNKHQYDYNSSRSIPPSLTLIPF